MSHGRDGLLQESGPSSERHAASDSSAALLLTELLSERNHTREREYKLVPAGLYFGSSGEHSNAFALADGVESLQP
jgi:hypothetical protein